MKKARRFLSFLLAFVMLAGVLPPGVIAESADVETYCGYTAHQHDDTCIKKTLICGFDTETAEAAETEDTVTEQTSNHIHTDDCYETQSVLSCQQTEHQHSAEDGCYISTCSETVCEMTEHTHSEGCYSTKQDLVCESEEHTHSVEAGCYDEDGNLICEIPEHTHSEADGCYVTEQILICDTLEHTHSVENGCYTIEQTLVCEIPEHIHLEENGCYSTENVLICNQNKNSENETESESLVEIETDTETDTESEENITSNETAVTHVHTDSCYEITYICGYTEHLHTLSCYSNPDADVETEADWEKTFADVELTGIYADDLIAVAKTQIGYTESTQNYQVVHDSNGNETDEIKGYTRYGAWYGNEYGDWCAMFVSFCLNYAEIPADEFPIDDSCQNWIETLSDPEKEYELYRTSDEYSPKPGDLVFFDTDSDEKSDHVGIVSELIIESAESEELYENDTEYMLTGFKVIEGNCENEVKENEYKLIDESILGYGMLPENPNPVTETKVNTLTYESEDGVTFTAEGEFPENAHLEALKLDDSQIAYIGENFANITLGKENFAYDIKIYDEDGTELALEQNVLITISGLEISNDTEISGYHLVDVDADNLTEANGVLVERLGVTSEEDSISFTTDSFSVMLFTAGETEAATFSVENLQISKFEITFSSGGKLTSVTNTDENGVEQTDKYYVWTATDSAAGHEFVYRVDYTTSGVGSIPAETFVIKLPLHMLKDSSGNWADSFDCAYLNITEVTAGEKPELVYQIEGDYVYIYNYSEIDAGYSGYIEFSYTTTKQTYNYVDLGIQTTTLDGTLSIGTAVNEIISGATAEDPKTASATGINIDTGVKITSTSKQTPTRYTSWQSSWGTRPSDADDYYYFSWPIYTVIGKGTQKYNLIFTDSFSDFGGNVIAYRFSGSSSWTAADENGSATVPGLTPSSDKTVERYDYVLVRCSKSEILSYLKEQYPDFTDLQSEDIDTMEEAEETFFNSGKYTLKYTIKNSITATVDPADGKDDDTSASASKTYTYELKPYENPKIASTSKQTPTKYTSWQSSWGTKPSDADDYYYFSWPIYTVISKGTQKYNLIFTDSFSDFGGKVIAYRFSGSSSWVAADENGSATVLGLTPSSSKSIGRYDYVVVSCKKSEILSYLKAQYPEFTELQSEDIDTMEKAEKLFFESGRYTLKYTIKNSITVTVDPVGEEDGNTSASASKIYVYELKPYEAPTSKYYADKWGIYNSNSRVYTSENISSYELSEYLERKVDSITGLKYYTYIQGYPGPQTLADGVTGTLNDAKENNYFKKSVTYSLADKDFSLQALTYESGSGISGTSQALTSEDYDVTSLQWNTTVQTATFNEDSYAWSASTIYDFSNLDYTPETGFDKNALYFYIYTADEEWVLVATYSLESSTYIKTEEGNSYISNTTGSGTSGTIYFANGVKGYKIEMSNPFYYTKIGAYPTVSLNHTNHVAQILLGSGTIDDLYNLYNSNPEALTKITVINKATGTITQDQQKVYSQICSGTDYVSAVIRHATLSKRVVSTANNKQKREYKITWSITLKETYTDDTGSHTGSQESGVFYDLLPIGAILDSSTIKVTASSGTLNSGKYEIEQIDNYNSTGRTMLKVTIHEVTNSSYTLSYTTIHTWDSIKDYGKKELNSVAYETGNEYIGDGCPDNGGNISEKGLMSQLTEDTSDDKSGVKKFLFAETSWSIDSLLAANTGLRKQVKASNDTEYSYSTTVPAEDSYSYQIRFANDPTTVSEDIMIFDSLEYFHKSNSEAAITSDWKGTLTGIDCSQLDTKLTNGYTVYVSEVENLNFYQLNGTDSGETTGDLNKNYDFVSDKTAKWIKLSDYQAEHNGDLSGVHAIAIDARGNQLAAGDSIIYTLYMKVPLIATDQYAPFGDNAAYNNIFMSRTALNVVTDEETGVTSIDESSATPSFFHQDYTQVYFRPTGNAYLMKVNQDDTTETVSGATYMLSGTSDYETVYELAAASNKNGLLTFTNLETGTYTLQEISCGSDWLLNKEVYTVTMTLANDGTVNAELSGYEFPDGNSDGVWDTQEVNGVIRYLLTDAPRICGDLSFIKADSITEKGLSNAEFKLYGTSSYDNDILMYAVSESDGTVSFTDIELGNYTLVEIAVPDGHIPAQSVWTVTVGEDGTPQISGDVELSSSGDYIIKNEPYHKVQFLKKSTYGISNYIEGIEFTLSGTSDYGNYYEETATSGDYYGMVQFDGLEPGTYELVETDTSGAKDSTWDEEKQVNGLTYQPNNHKYTVVVNADDTFTINGLNTERIADTEGDTAGSGDFYVFTNTPENGVITVTKIWIDDVDNSERMPTDLDITVSTDEPNPAIFGETVITFYANGGSFSDGSTSHRLSYTEYNGEMTIFGGGNYIEPAEEDNGFAKWYTDATFSTQVLVNDIGYPVDSSGNLITPTTENQTIWTSLGKGYTLTLYAKYKSIYNMKYAVRLYGIQTDIGEDGKTALGLTFGPATGADYRNSYVAHADKDSGTICLHWMTWDEIAAQSKKDPTIFNECLKNGCTHSVDVSLNDDILDAAQDVSEWNGDGAGMFYGSINKCYRYWNSSVNYGGWQYSRVRYTLNGWNGTDSTTYSGTTYLCTSENSLLSCFEEDLQNVIVVATKSSNTGYNNGNNPLYNSSGATTYDRLWLLSCNELNNISQSECINYDETGSQCYWWSRSAHSDNSVTVYSVYNSKTWNNSSVSGSNCGLAPGFCLA